MKSEYGQFCPIALASEVLAQKWMLLIVRELNAGSTRFNDIRRGVPRISATLLKQRLRQLEDAGIVQRQQIEGGSIEEYILTEAGRELQAVIGSIGQWGQRWARGIEKDDLDPGWLVWVMHRRLDLSTMPEKRTVLELDFIDAPRNHHLFWLVCENDKVDICIKPPGFDVDLRISMCVRTLAEVWRGLHSIKDEIRQGKIQLEGHSSLIRQFPDWLMLSVFAGIERPAAARNKRDSQ